jgi:hypothetical protein
LLRFSDARNFGRTGTGLALFLAPVLFLIAGIVEPSTDHKNKVEELNAVAAHKGTYLLSGILWLAAGIALMLAAVGLIKMFRGPRGITAGQFGATLLMLGGAVTFGWYAFGVAEYEMVNHQGLNRPALAQFLDKADSTATVAPLIITFLLGIVLGIILLGIACWRTRAVPRWVAVLLIIEGPFAFFSDGKVAGIVSFVIMLITFGSIALRAFSMSDEEWDAPRDRYSLAAEDAPPAPAPAPAV